MATATDTPTFQDSISWINSLSSFMQSNSAEVEPNQRTVLSSDVKNKILALFIPQEMQELQPDNLRYLHALASRNGCLIVEDRRKTNVRPLVEQRDLKPHKLAIGIAELIKHAGMPGPSPKLSTPHRLVPESRHINVPLLIQMVSATVKNSKKVVILPTPAMVESTGNETHPISAFACKLVIDDNELLISYFDSPGFKAIGYVADSQFVVHVLIGGGPISSPQIWANNDAMDRNKFRFQLFPSPQKGQDFGLLYNTFYLDIEQESGTQGRKSGHA